MEGTGGRGPGRITATSQRSVATGRAGLGTTPTIHYNKPEGKERQDLVQREVRAGVEEQHASQTVG